MSVEQSRHYEASSQTEKILRNPPQLILVFDNHRARNKSHIEHKTMATRAGMAALFFYSSLYPDNGSRPTICCFAGNHDPGIAAGSRKVAGILTRIFSIPADAIYTKENTITTTTDLLQLHSTALARNTKSILIVTTDDHVKRTKMEVSHHFNRRGRNIKNLQIEVVGPSSEIFEQISIPSDLHGPTKRAIARAIETGKTGMLSGGLNEKLATLIASIPTRLVRRTVQSWAEARTHEYTPAELARIMASAKTMRESAKKRKAGKKSVNQ